MDFWDMARVMWRRWYLTVPLLLLTGVAVILTANTVQPDFRSTDHIVVLPSVIERTSDDEVTRVNPWTEESLADAAAIRLMGKAMQDRLYEAGYDAEWTVAVGGIVPVLTIEVVAPSEIQARAAMEDLLTAVEAEIVDRQATYGISEEEQITTVRYDEGEILEAVTSKMKRAVVVVAAIGILLTMATAVSVDAFYRRRRARREQALAVPPGRAARRYEFGGYREGGLGEGETEPVGARANGHEHEPANDSDHLTYPIQVGYAEEVPRTGSGMVPGQRHESDDGGYDDSHFRERPVSPGPVTDIVPGPHPDKVSSSARVPHSAPPAPGSGPPAPGPARRDDTTVVIPLAGVMRPRRHSDD